jgi:hypothetical protein
MPTIKKEILEQRQGLRQRKRYHGSKPDLRVTDKVKYANDMEHVKAVMDYYVESSWFQDHTTTSSGNYRDLYMLYDAYNTFIPEENFNYITNPYNSSKQDNKAFPSRIRPYSIIRPNIDLLLGEWDKRPFNYTVVVTSNDVVSKAEQEIQASVVGVLEQMFINEMNAQGQQTGMPSQEVEPPAEVKAKKQQSFKDARAVRGQNVINRAMHENNLTPEWRRMFKDWTIVGEAYSWRGVKNNDLFYERVSPLDLDYDKSPDNEYVEDGGWAVRRKFQLPTDIVSEHWEELEEFEVDMLEDMDSNTPFTSSYYNTLFGGSHRTEEDMRRSKITVYHVNFKMYKKIGILSFTDEMGQPQMIDVDENYKVDRDAGEEIEWSWIVETWEGKRIDTGYDSTASTNSDSDTGSSVYLGVRKVEEERSAINNMSYCKLNYNGLRYSDTHSKNISIVEMGLPYQVLYQIMHYKLEMTIAKSKGKIALMDINTIPNKKGWDEEKFFYYAEAMGFGLIDRNQAGTDKTWNQYQVLDMGLYEHINNLIQVMEYVKSEWDQLVGITPQRKGQTSASETATGVSTARYQSALISERAFSRYEEFLQRELQAIIDYSKFANIGTEKEPFYRDDFTMEMIHSTPEEYMEAEYGVYVSNTAQDVEDLGMLKQIIPNMATQGTSPSDMIDMIMTRNVSKIKSVLAEKEAKEQEAAAGQAQSEQEAQIKAQEIQKEYAAINFEFDNMLQDNKYEHEKDLTHIKGQYDLADTNEPGDIDTINPMDIEANMIKRDEIVNKTGIEREKIAAGREKVKADSEAKKYAADTSLKVAKENKNQFDTPKKKS